MVYRHCVIIFNIWLCFITFSYIHVFQYIFWLFLGFYIPFNLHPWHNSTGWHGQVYCFLLYSVYLCCLCHFPGTLSCSQTDFLYFSVRIYFCFRRGLSPFLTLLSTLSVSFWISWHDTLCFLSDCCVVLYLHSSASILLACAGMGTIVDDTVWLVAAIDGALVYCSWFVFSFHLCRLHHLHSILVSFCVILASIHSYVLGLLVFFALKSVELSLSRSYTLSYSITTCY